MMRTARSWLVIVSLVFMSACAGMQRTARARTEAQGRIATAENEIGIAKQGEAGTYAPQRLLEASASLSAAKRQFEAKAYDDAARSAQAAIFSARGAVQLAQEAKKKKEQAAAEEKKAKEDAQKKALEETKKKAPSVEKAKAMDAAMKPKPKK